MFCSPLVLSVQSASTTRESGASTSSQHFTVCMLLRIPAYLGIDKQSHKDVFQNKNKEQRKMQRLSGRTREREHCVRVTTRRDTSTKHLHGALLARTYLSFRLEQRQCRSHLNHPNCTTSRSIIENVYCLIFSALSALVAPLLFSARTVLIALPSILWCLLGRPDRGRHWG